MVCSDFKLTVDGWQYIFNSRMRFHVDLVVSEVVRLDMSVLLLGLSRRMPGKLHVLVRIRNSKAIQILCEVMNLVAIR